MILEPIIKAKLNNFKSTYECSLSDDLAFERFVNWVLLQRHQPGAFTADFDLLDSVCVGGQDDMGIDGMCIKINGILIKSISEAKDIVSNYNKVSIDFIFIQSKNKNSLKQGEHNQFITGVKDFLNTKQYQPINPKLKDWLDIKNYLLDENCCLKWIDNPSIFIYYVYLGENSGSPYIKATENRFIDDIRKLRTYNDKINIEIITAEKLKKYCDENENNYEARLNIIETCSFFGENEHIENVDLNSTVAICRANELLKLIKSDDDLLRRGIFDDNVRDYQGDTAINNEILQTIIKSPENFVLFNNGITIVCDELITNGKTLKIKNPQIVNGCQTCNVIFNASKQLEDIENLNLVKVVLKIIATTNDNIINNIVRGTNKQNIVQEEAFETIREFHKNLEDFFVSFNGNLKMPFPLYYERRARQYDRMNIKEISKVKFSTLIRSFVSIFLSEPHKSINHPAILQKEYKNKIFIDSQSLLPYYASAQVNAFIENSSRLNKIPKDVKSYKSHIAYLFCLVNAGFIPNINKSKQIDEYSNKIIAVLKNQTDSEKSLTEAINIFIEARTKWIKLKGQEFKYGIKDRADFTEFLNTLYREKAGINSTVLSNLDKSLQYRGIICDIRQNSHGKLYGFITQNDGSKIYFNEKSIGLKIASNMINKEVFYDIVDNPKGKKAVNINIIEN